MRSPLRFHDSTCRCASRRVSKVQAGLIIPGEDEMQALLSTASQPPAATPRQSPANRAILAAKPGTIVIRRAFDVGMVGQTTCIRVCIDETVHNRRCWRRTHCLPQLHQPCPARSACGPVVWATHGSHAARGPVAPRKGPPHRTNQRPPHNLVRRINIAQQRPLHLHVHRLSHVGTRMWRTLAAVHDPSILHTHGSVHTTSRAGDPAGPLVELLHDVCQVHHFFVIARNAKGR